MIERMESPSRPSAARGGEAKEIVVMTMTTTLSGRLVSQTSSTSTFSPSGMGHAGDFGLGLALAASER